MESGYPTGKGERLAVLLLCLVGAAHVFIFSAAFPFFSVVDEQVHFDLVVRYSHGDLPRSLTPPCAEALPFIAIYGTPEFLWPPASQPGGKLAPALETAQGDRPQPVAGQRGGLPGKIQEP